MPEQKLNKTLGLLKTVMHEALDEGERDRLSELMTRIAGGRADNSVHDDLAAKAADFEVSHPVVARALREVMDTLNKMGI